MDILRLHVLLVNEDPKLLETMQNCLIEQGFEVSLASTQEQALKLLGHNSYHVLVTDITMPENDGIFLAKRLADHTPIVMLKNTDDQRMVADLDQFTCCYLDKSEIHTRLAQAAWKAYQRFKIDRQITRDRVAA